MEKRLIKFSAYVLVIIIGLGFLNHVLLAQKKFEGYWDQQVIRKSTLPGQPPSVTENEKAYYKTGKMKIANLTTGKHIIIRLDKELMWNVDDKSKSYTEVTFAEMERSMDEAKSAMKDQMKDMDPEERKMMEKLMGKKLGSAFGSGEGTEITVKQTGKRKKILDYDCEQVIMYLNNQQLMEMWMTDKYDLGSEFLKLYERMGFLKGKLSEEAKKIRGISVLSKASFDSGMGKIDTETKVTKIEATSVSDSEFDVPKGYAKKKMAMPFDRQE